MPWLGLTRMPSRRPFQLTPNLWANVLAETCTFPVDLALIFGREPNLLGILGFNALQHVAGKTVRFIDSLEVDRARVAGPDVEFRPLGELLFRFLFQPRRHRHEHVKMKNATRVLQHPCISKSEVWGSAALQEGCETLLHVPERVTGALQAGPQALWANSY